MSGRWSIALLFLVNACNCEGEPPPGAPIVPDATADAAIEDAFDASTSDADLGDVATSSDAGALDADLGDVPTSSDAGSLDDAGVDGGTDLDAAVADGGECRSSVDCINGEVYGNLHAVNMMTVEADCVPSNLNGGAIGSACTTGAQCFDALCLSTVSGECSVVCTDAMRDCPNGFSCTGYRYNPGAVWFGLCSRVCTDNDDCAVAGGAIGNFCSTQVFFLDGTWDVDLVCQGPPGTGALGAVCTVGNDCQSGLCLTTARGTCMMTSECMPDEICDNNSCVSKLCSFICDDPTDCATPNQPLTLCDATLNFDLPDGTSVPIAACARP